MHIYCITLFSCITVSTVPYLHYYIMVFASVGPMPQTISQ
jgi:hypothetical protein